MRSSHAHRAILVALLGLAGPALRAFAGIPGGHLEIRFYSESGPLCSPILHEPVDAYVVLVDDPCPGALAGWELRIEPDPGVHVTETEIYGDAVRASAAPDYAVSYGNPPPVVEGDRCLMRLEVFAVQPGAVRLAAVASPSIPGAGAPIVMSSPDGQRFEVAPQGGMSDGGSMGIRDDCAFPSTGFVELSSYRIPNTRPYTAAPNSYLSASSTMSVPTGSLAGWRRLFFQGDFCFVGRVIDLRYDCVVDGESRGVESFAVVNYAVERSFWGIAAPQVIVVSRCSRWDDCVAYRFPTYDDFRLGEACLVLGRERGGRRQAYDQGVLPVDGQAVRSARGELLAQWPDAERSLSTLAKGRSLDEQARQADLVCYVTVSEHIAREAGPAAVVQVSRVMAGAEASPVLTVALSHSPDDAAWEDFFYPPQLEPGAEYLVFLRREDGGAYALLRGARSAFRHVGDDLKDKRDHVWGKARTAEAVIADVRR